MKNRISLLGIIVFVAIIGLCFIACDDGGGTTGGNTNTNQTPVASDYDIANLDQGRGNVIAVTITAKSGKSPGAISNIRYAGSTAVPQTLGTYVVYFDVAAATGWNAAADIFAGNLIIGYTIGDTGPSGGIVIYDKGSVSDGWRYLEAAPANQATSVRWSSTNIDVTGATGTAIGTGKANTAAIIAAHTGDTANNAAKAAAAYIGGGKNDWFLPSKDELNEMYKVRTHLGISSGWFWSSSQSNDNYVWIQNFGNGLQGYNGEGNNYGVRAVRAF